MNEYPYTIENGGGEQLTFVGTGHDEQGEYLEARNTVAPGAGPPMHVHYLTGFVRPPDNLEYFLSEIFASTRRNGGKRPGTFDAAYLLRRYGDEFGMMVPPQPVQRILFPVIVAAGRVLGWDRRFADAPEPVRRAAADVG